MAILTAICCSSAMAAGKPLKVYILVGQSNMQGQAKAETFDYIADDLTVSGPAIIKASIASARPIVRVSLVRDGLQLPSVEVGKKQAHFTLADRDPGPGGHWYSFTVEAESAYKDIAIGHASPSCVKVK
jgi:hypothetical protein